MDDTLDANLIPEQNGQDGVRSVNNTSQMNGSHTNSTTVKISQRRVDDDRYKIKTGKAVVINNIEFNPRLELPDRRGSDVDASSLFQRFQELDFDSDLLNDATIQDVREKIQEIKDDVQEEPDKTDCLVFVFLTHGNEDEIYATDGLMKIKNLMDAFSAENCRELILKPKIFIFQACRGRDIGRGVNARIIRDKNQADAAGESEEYDEMFGETIRIPNEADFLAIYSSSSGYGSFRNTEKGSPFVRILSEELVRMEPGEDFYKVLTRVNRKVGTGYKPNFPNRNDITQMPCFISHLTKDLILKQ